MSNNRFEHLTKNKPKTDNFMDFISGAEKNTSEETKIATKKVSTKSILLSISGRMDRERECGKPIQLHLKKSLNNEIDKYCHGNKQAILNYLIKRGLDNLIEKGELVLATE